MTLLRCNVQKKSFVSITSGTVESVLSQILDHKRKTKEDSLPSRKQSIDMEAVKELPPIQGGKEEEKEEEKPLVFLNSETRKKENCESVVRKFLRDAGFVVVTEKSES